MKPFGVLLVFFFFTAVAWAAPRNRMTKSSSAWENAIVAPELGLGIPIGKIAEEGLKNQDLGSGPTC